MSRKATGEQDALAIRYGNIQGQPAVVAVQDFAFMGGSLSMAVGEAFVKAAQEAVKREVPFVIFTAASIAQSYEQFVHPSLKRAPADYARMA